MIISNELLQQAYKKLKSHLYTDKTLLAEKIELAQFENDLEKKLKEIEIILTSGNQDISKWIKNVSYTLVPKKIEDLKKEDNFFTNQTKQNIYHVESYNIFIKAPIEIHIIATLWTMLIGEGLDSILQDNIKGNRLYRDKNKQFQNKSYKLFRPYYEGYQGFRDEAIDMATYLHNKNLDVTILNIDIQEFYYNIDFEFSSLDDLIKEEYKFLNDLMQKIHNGFHKVINKLHPNSKIEKYFHQKFLPIGLVSSSVIANYLLYNLDEDIIKNVKPEYYSRYVDDMLFVFSNADINLNSKTVVADLLSCKLQNSKIRTGTRSVQLKTNGRVFKLQNKKVKLFHFDKNDSISLLKKFKEKIDENSSFFNFMPDDEKLFKTLESSSYNMFYDNSKNKLSSLIGTTKDTLSISRNLTGILTTVASAKFDKKHLAIYNQQLENVFSGQNIFELRLHWEKVFTYLYITNSDNLLVRLFVDFYKTIEKLSNQKLLEDTQEYLLNSVLFAISSNPTHFEKNLIQKIEENNILLEQRINTTDIKNIRKSNMFSNHLMTYPLLNYMNFFDNDGWAIKDDFNFLSQAFDIKNLKFSLNKFKIKNTPRYIHYHELILFNHFRFINKKDNFYATNTIFIERLYNYFNGFDKSVNNTFPSQYENKYIITKNKKENTDKLKIGIVSLKTSIKDITASYVTSPNLSYSRLQGIFDILNKSIEEKHKVDLLVFPEVSIPYAWVHLLARFAKKNNIGIVFGVEHIKTTKDENKNLVSNYTCVILPFNTDGHTSLFINFEAKKHFAPDEKIDIQSRGFEVNENKKKKPTLYKFRGSVFSTFNCYELTDISYRSSLVGEVDFLVAIEYNKDTNYFSNIIDSLSRDTHCYIVQVNTSDYGDSRIVQPSKTESKDLVKLKGGENIYLVVDLIDIKKLRNFQVKGHCLQKQDKSFKLVPPNFKISGLRVDNAN
ncbi:MAG: reverse transcriptase domain-containing protein [Campylobacterota bacterium]|nr:reverse transcriptase domain-containing protein [Campylobacterota bacterium]